MITLFKSAFTTTALLTVMAVSAHAAEDKAAGEARATENCISLAHIDRSEVIDDRTILFHMKGDKIWQNKLPHRCFGLKFEDGFGYATSLSQLCSTDIITVLNRGTKCGLGQFTEYTKEDQEKAEKAKAEKSKSNK